MSKIIVIDPGHGGSDPGAQGNGLREKDLTLNISKRIRKYLEDNYEGIKVLMTRTNDKYLTLSQRAQFANSKSADLFISIHINAGGGTGYESFIHTSQNSNTATGKMQTTVHNEAMKKINVVDRGKKRANFAVLRETNMRAILPENLFIDRKEDAAKLKESSELQKIAEGHAIGIAKALGLKSKKGGGTSQSKPKPKPSKPATDHTKPTQKESLTVDSKWGRAVTRALQSFFDTPEDGILSGQLRNGVTNALYGNTASFGGGGSVVIKALQRYLNTKGFNLTVDGLLGPSTVRALQSYLGTPVDGVLSRPSVVVGELQRRLNAGTF